MRYNHTTYRASYREIAIRVGPEHVQHVRPHSAPRRLEPMQVSKCMLISLENGLAKLIRPNFVVLQRGHKLSRPALIATVLSVEDFFAGSCSSRTRHHVRWSCSTPMCTCSSLRCTSCSMKFCTYGLFQFFIACWGQTWVMHWELQLSLRMDIDVTCGTAKRNRVWLTWFIGSLLDFNLGLKLKERL